MVPGEMDSFFQKHHPRRRNRGPRSEERARREARGEARMMTPSVKFSYLIDTNSTFATNVLDALFSVAECMGARYVSGKINKEGSMTLDFTKEFYQQEISEANR